MKESQHPEHIKLAELLHAARNRRGLSQEEVAAAMSLPRSAVSCIERGRRRVDLSELKQFAKLYHRPLAYFLGKLEVEESEDLRDLLRVAARLPSEYRSELLRFAKMLKFRADGDKAPASGQTPSRNSRR